MTTATDSPLPPSADAVIVGAGPAGLTAAAALAAGGMSVCVLDEASAPGGQIGRRRFDAAWEPADQSWGRPYRKLLGRDGLSEEVISGASVWAIGRLEGDAAGDSGERFEVQVSSAGHGAGSVRCRWVLLAAGAYDALPLVPGWTLPGVVGAGALQTIVKGGGLKGSERLAIHGSHPLCLAAAAEAVRRGHPSVSLLISATRWELVRDAFRYVRCPTAALAKLPQLVAAAGRLARSDASLRFGVSIERIVQGAPGREVHLMQRRSLGADQRMVVVCDVVGASVGLHASSELGRSMGCSSTWDRDSGGWLLDRDADGESSVPGVLVAGEVTGVAGAESAAAEGRLAALTILGSDGAQRGWRDRVQRFRLRRRVARWRRFGIATAALGRASRSRDLLAAPPEVVICRCEGVTVGEVGDCVADPLVVTGRDLKLATRLGMGRCQGRYCGPALGALLECQGRPSASWELVPRVPVKPLVLDVAPIGTTSRHPSRKD